MASVYESVHRSLPNQGKSFLIVERVQELVKKQKETIPERYIRRDEERPTPTSIFNQQLDIPIIGMAKLSEGLQREGEINKISMDSEEWGFFQVVNHGIQNSLIDGIKRVGNEFFQLPSEEKQKYAVNPRDLEGYGHKFVVSEGKKMDWGDLLGLKMSPSECKDLNVWPLQPTEFRCTSNIYVRAGKY